MQGELVKVGSMDWRIKGNYSMVANYSGMQGELVRV